MTTDEWEQLELSETVDLIRWCESEGEIRRYLQGLGVYGVNPWLARSVEVFAGHVLVTSAVPDEYGKPTPRRHTVRHEREVIGPDQT